MGRRPLGKAYETPSITLFKYQIELLDELAELRGTNRSSAMRWLLDKILEKTVGQQRDFESQKMQELGLV